MPRVEKIDVNFWKKRTIKQWLRMFFYIILGIPKTIVFNFYYLGLEGIKFPFILSYKVKINRMKGIVKLDAPQKKFGMIKLGFPLGKTYDNGRYSFVWANAGVIVFQGTAGIRNGATIANYGLLTIGNEFHVSATAKIICYKKITFGSDVLIGWNTEIIDGDAHKIIDDFGERKNSDREIKIGNHVWIGANSKIMKGACIGDNSIIASNTILLSNIDLNGVIVGDLPNRILKQNINWKV